MVFGAGLLILLVIDLQSNDMGIWVYEINSSKKLRRKKDGDHRERVKVCIVCYWQLCILYCLH